MFYENVFRAALERKTDFLEEAKQTRLAAEVKPKARVRSGSEHYPPRAKRHFTFNFLHHTPEGTSGSGTR